MHIIFLQIDTPIAYHPSTQMTHPFWDDSEQLYYSAPLIVLSQLHILPLFQIATPHPNQYSAKTNISSGDDNGLSLSCITAHRLYVSTTIFALSVYIVSEVYIHFHSSISLRLKT